MNASTLRRQIELEEFDSLILLDRLREYAHPRDRITELLRSGDIIRVKKGIYVFGPEHRRRPVCRELLANWIYGPSYLSLEFALQFHGLIPEGVEELTSVTMGRSRRFSTPLGEFSYRRIPRRAFSIGMDRVELDNGLSYLMATPEKALADKLVSDRHGGLASQTELREHLLENLRIAMEDLATLNPARLREIAERYRSRRVRLLSEIVDRMNGRTRKRVSKPSGDAVSLEIHPFTLAHYDAVLALWKQTEGIGLSDADSRENIARYLVRNPGTSFVAIDADAEREGAVAEGPCAEQGRVAGAEGNVDDARGRVVGAVLGGHDGRRGFIHHLAVAPAARRQGLGRRLVDRALDALKSEGIQKCHLFIFADNANGIAFWKSTGWTWRKDIGIMSRNL